MGVFSPPTNGARVGNHYADKYDRYSLGEQLFTSVAMAFLFLLLVSLQASIPFAYDSTYPMLDAAAGETSNDTTTVPIYFALIMSFGGAFNSSGTVPGVQIALDLINSHPTLLPGYSLHYTATDSQVKLCQYI